MHVTQGVDFMQEPADLWSFAHLTDISVYEPEVASLPHVVYQPQFTPYLASASNYTAVVTATEAGPLNGRDGALPEGIEDWPQRLLHVPTWTSLEWQPGNFYGQWREPQFNALSYTWARYQKSRKQKRGQKRMRLKIEGLQWKFAYISPSHFRPESLKNAIIHAKHISSEAQGTDEVQFLWIDQACMDQRPGTTQDIEICRQAAIFKKAQEVYIWITTKDENHLRSIWETLETAASSSKGCNSLRKQNYQDTSVDKWLSNAYTALEDLIQDPWFTSLWTLQEVSVRPDAKVLDKEGGHVNHGTSMATFQSLLDSCATLDTVCRKALRPGNYNTPKSRILRNIIMLLETSGLAALATRNPINIYSVTRFRATDCDRSYVRAVQGLFISTNETPSCELLSPSDTKVLLASELEWKLGVAFLRRNPVLSQMHIFTEPPADGQAWRFNQTSWVPRIMGGGGSWSLQYESYCSLTLHGDVESPCVFEGKMTRYEDLHDMFANGWETEVDSQLPLQTWLDASPFRPISVPLLDNHDRENPATKEDVNKLFQKHRNTHPEGELCVLLLGYYNSTPEHTNDIPHNAIKRYFHVGLLIFRPSVACSRSCRRFGFCVWQSMVAAQVSDSVQEILVQAHVGFG